MLILEKGKLLLTDFQLNLFFWISDGFHQNYLYAALKVTLEFGRKFYNIVIWHVVHNFDWTNILYKICKLFSFESTLDWFHLSYGQVYFNTHPTLRLFITLNETFEHNFVFDKVRYFAQWKTSRPPHLACCGLTGPTLKSLALGMQPSVTSSPERWFYAWLETQ